MVDVATRPTGDHVLDLALKWQEANRENAESLEAYSIATERLAAETGMGSERLKRLLAEVAAAERRADAAHDDLAELTQVILLQEPHSLRGAARILEVVSQEHFSEPDMVLARYALTGVIKLLDRSV